MPQYTVEIGDTKGHAFRVAMVVPISDDVGSWRTLDKGRIRYNSGALKQFKFEGDAPGQFNINFFGPDGMDAGWGFWMESFKTLWIANDEGTGSIMQSWVLEFEPGKTSWSLVE
jgi:hypothetical protein